MSFIPNNHMVELIVCGIQMSASALSLVGSEVTEEWRMALFTDVLLRSRYVINHFVEKV